MNTPFEKRVCLTICICQLTAVLSCVSMVYLTVAVYMPSYRTLNSGFSENTVMCTTVSNKTVPNCEEEEGVPSWSSCGEWCLSKSSGTCTQIRVDVRRNGSNIRLEECDPAAFDTKYCHGIDPKMKVYECINGECASLHGIFNCTKGPGSPTGEQQGAICKNLTSVLSCNLTTTDQPIVCNTRKACLHFDGLYECNYGECARVRPPFKCEKRCIAINTYQKDIMIRQGDIIYTAKCARARDIETEIEIWPKNLRSIKYPDRPPMLMMFCTTLLEVPNDKTTFTLSDCFNGTTLEPDHFGNSTNITYVLQSHYESYEHLLDVERRFVPPEPDLLIYNATPLYINHDACVNTLILQECEKFHAEYGGDGADLRSQSRFQCFYSPNSTEFVVLRFSRLKTIMELLITAAVPMEIIVMVGAAGIVASTLNNRHARRESRSSQHGDEPPNNSSQHQQHQLCVGRVGSRATISEGIASRTVPGPPLSASLLSGSRDIGGGLLNNSTCHSRPATALSSSNLNRSCNITGSPGGGGGGLPLDPEIIPEKLSLKEQVKFYVSLTLGIVASVCVFALLFLIPLVVEPSISTLLADFDPEAATCVTIDYTYATGLSKCGRWSSCREGCTSTPSQCHQIYVSYRKAGSKPGYPRIENFTMVDPSDWLDESKWDVSYTQLLINAKGCGYPPKVRCDDYGETYKQLGRTFPCYYSRANPRLVVTDYNWQETASPLLIALGLPTSLFAVSISILSFWYCPSCEERGKNKRPCRSRYQTTKAHDDLDDMKRSNSHNGKAKDKSSRSNNNNNNNGKGDDNGSAAATGGAQPIIQQPRGKPSNNTNSSSNPYHQPRSPSLATISSRDTTVSSVNSMDDGWQSPPSPPPRMNSRIHSSKSNLTTRARKL